MNEIKIGSLRLTDATTTTGKRMLAAYKADGTRLLMDTMARAVEDGQNGYLFDNKYIIIVHWNGFSNEDIVQTTGETLRMRLFATENGLWTTVKFGDYDWGDVITLPGLMSGFNDSSLGFTDVVILFVDSSIGEPLELRCFPISHKVGDFIAERSRIAYDWFAHSGFKAKSYSRTSTLLKDWLDASMRITRELAENPPDPDTAFVTFTVGLNGKVSETF